MKLIMGMLIALSLMATICNAAPQFNVLGAGTASCGEWTKARKTRSHLEDMFVSWVQGFLTALNAVLASRHLPGTADVSDGIDAEGLLAWIDNYCSQHPLDSIAKATLALNTELTVRAGKRALSR